MREQRESSAAHLYPMLALQMRDGACVCVPLRYRGGCTAGRPSGEGFSPTHARGARPRRQRSGAGGVLFWPRTTRGSNGPPAAALSMCGPGREGGGGERERVSERWSAAARCAGHPGGPECKVPASDSVAPQVPRHDWRRRQRCCGPPGRPGMQSTLNCKRFYSFSSSGPPGRSACVPHRPLIPMNIGTRSNDRLFRKESTLLINDEERGQPGGRPGRPHYLCCDSILFVVAILGSVYPTPPIR